MVVVFLGIHNMVVFFFGNLHYVNLQYTYISRWEKGGRWQMYVGFYSIRGKFFPEPSLLPPLPRESHREKVSH